ncbi:M23 family metallopeptidase [Methylocystis sp. H62]|uniref:M23 family metallopeptidase n=1 Tax=Methylocystis sp. H62 TaxID=2785789 RepID=UPI0018C1E0C8|nr:M23 family metallopeptidase [Methylocystis sp. H62]MBG0792437.1 M23 family metallopeptidase [Methylocystis sp. H62]MBG0792913.1 M23 family metallopeptidase [Methylocystis sp. H62]
MSAADLGIIGLQIVLPLALLVWFGFAPIRSTLGHWLQFASTGLALIALCFAPPWLALPWWTPVAYLAIWFSTVLVHIISRRISSSRGFPSRASAWASLVLFGLLGMLSGVVSVTALSGRWAHGGAAIDLAFPLGPGVYLVANGGSRDIVNAHFLTLNPATERQRAYRGQSYGVDLVKLGGFGLRAPGWRPREPARYEIFGEPVLAPCAGAVLSAGDGMPDMPVPEQDRSRLEGNYVFLDCDGVGVLLAHFQNGSLRVETGDRVVVGEQVALAGNSGQSGEPHLHIHAQRLADNAAMFSGEPLFISFDGRFPVRNDRIAVSTR